MIKILVNKIWVDSQTLHAAIVLGLCLLFALPMLARRTTILISCDGFRWDYPQYYDTPFLNRMAAEGVSGELVPSFPSKTFPNHYTLVTGLRPEHRHHRQQFHRPHYRRSLLLRRPQDKV